MYRILMIIALAMLAGCVSLKGSGRATPAPVTASGAPSAAGQCTPESATADPTLVKSVQARLTLLGYLPGPIDGVAGDQTHDAIRQYQKDHKLLQDGRVTPELLDHIKAVQRIMLKDASVNI
jgi:peptidoglycan hydrolase-like protein with peptidoglycan-binding domain